MGGAVPPLSAGPATNGARLPSLSLCLRIVLLDAEPAIWRRVRVPSRMTLLRLHGVLRCALGRPDVEAHRFRVGDVLYGNTVEGLPTRDSRWATLDEFVANGIRSFRYELAAPGTAVHEVRVEAILEGSADDGRAVCLGGSGVLSGGDGAGDDGLAFIVPDVFDTFDLEAVNRALARLGLGG
jgi:uncharacterized protein